MVDRITTTEPVRLDILAQELMGRASHGALEALLAANPGLAAEGAYVTEGRVINVPETPAIPDVPVVNPWD